MGINRDDRYLARAGYQFTETSGAEVTIYSHSDDIILLDGKRTLNTKGRLRNDSEPAVTAFSWHKALGAPSGAWSITLKPTYDSELAIRNIVDNDWVDIVLTQQGQRFHVCRGLVDEVREVRNVGGTGATTTEYTITGRDFGKVLETTQVWFDMFSGEDVGGGQAIKIFDRRALRDGGVDKVVENYLFGYLQAISDVGRATWTLPVQMPGLISDSPYFIDNVEYLTDDYSDNPGRVGIDPNWNMPSGTVWSLAQEWSDPLFCELFVDLWGVEGDSSAPPLIGQELPPEDSKMVVVLRDRMFPLNQDMAAYGFPAGQDSLWFTYLTEHTIPRQWIVSTDVGRSGMERYNAFFVSSQLQQEFVKASIDLSAPLWDKTDIEHNGLRRFDVHSKYIVTNAAQNDLFTLSKAQRQLIRDWYAINPYLWSGTIALGCGAPNVRVGTKIRIPGSRGPEFDETYYVEEVDLQWSFGAGARSTFGVTRGWRGKDTDLANAIDELSGRYTIPTKKT